MGWKRDTCGGDVDCSQSFVLTRFEVYQKIEYGASIGD